MPAFPLTTRGTGVLRFLPDWANAARKLPDPKAATLRSSFVQIANEAPPRGAVARLSSYATGRPRATATLLTLLTAGLASVRLQYRSVHFDESITMEYARGSWTNLWHTVTGEDPNMSLYYLLAKVWTAVFGDSVVAFRSLSVVAASLCVPVVYAIGVRLFGVSAGLLAGLFVATDVFFLRYAQEARGYALVMLLTALSTYCFLVLLAAEPPSRRVRVGYVASSVLAFYTHFFAALVVFVHVLTLVVKRGRAAVGGSWLACYGAMAVLAAPMAYWALTLGGNPIGWLAKPDFGAIPATFAQLAGDGFLQLGVVIALSIAASRAAMHSRRLAFGLAFTASWAAIPVLLAFGVSQLKPIFLAKYLIVCLPAVALLAAAAITSLRPAGAALAATCVLLVLSGNELHDWYGFRGQEDWRSLTSFVAERIHPTDGIVFNAAYARSSVVCPAKLSDGPCIDGSPAKRSRSVAMARQRVWLVLTHSQATTESLRSALALHHRLQSRESFAGDIAAELYVPRQP
jgi:mannosyltransferase